ncbi:hypothetical protein [Aestuariicoccus sp. MJ-SS9]|uniref:hypothetical protein n=1 Tax=Aestuariicoccus sp. MJ-SS9 TaxID=3079855 RepID=UPI00290D1A52|nr:hypothetical protein [Aestuariicoccus sp. MJ-SS9]MDU8913058.1 hypothetical protein [Aestuariicoccus sp. MJ-SS9]
MKKRGFFALAGLVLAGALAFGGGSGTPRPDQVGYFKSEEGNRVMAYTAPEGMTEAEGRAFLGEVMHRPGRLTFAVIYPQGTAHPGHRLTTAPDYLTAAGMLDSAPHDGWVWGVVIDMAGSANFDLR